MTTMKFQAPGLHWLYIHDTPVAEVKRNGQTWSIVNARWPLRDRTNIRTLSMVKCNADWDIRRQCNGRVEEGKRFTALFGSQYDANKHKPVY